MRTSTAADGAGREACEYWEAPSARAGVVPSLCPLALLLELTKASTLEHRDGGEMEGDHASLRERLGTIIWTAGHRTDQGWAAGQKVRSRKSVRPREARS